MTTEDIFDDSSDTRDARDKSFWTWKEPPVLRRMETTPKSRGRASGRATPSPSSGGASRKGSEHRLNRVVSEDSGKSARDARLGSEVQDFWDPLGLMGDMSAGTPGPPAALKTAPKDSADPAPWHNPEEGKKPKDGHTE